MYKAVCLSVFPWETNSLLAFLHTRGDRYFYTQGGTNIFNTQEGVDIFHLHMVGYQVAKNLLGLVSWIILVSKGEGKLLTGAIWDVFGGLKMSRVE